MPLKYLDPETPVVFLALYWRGPDPIDLADLLETFDYLNHAMLTRGETERHLDTLLSAGLVETAAGSRYALLKAVYGEFHEFRNRRRRGRFNDAEAFIRRHDWQHPPPRVIRISHADFEAAYAHNVSKYEQSR